MLQRQLYVIFTTPMGGLGQVFGVIKTHFMAKTDEILAETREYKIECNEAFGGQQNKANATLLSVEEGITDVGRVFSFLEQAKLPLSQPSSNAPFSASNPALQLEVHQELLETAEAFRNEWEQHNLKVLGLTGKDLQDIYTNEPLSGIDAIDGMKISAPGVLGNWLRGMGANAVFASITGITIASATVFNRIAVPEMRRHGYTRRFATGVAGSSVLGMLIPPSLLMSV